VFEKSYLLLKAAAGGGGKGMRICYNEKFIYL
jgi:biotin carboxylase